MVRHGQLPAGGVGAVGAAGLQVRQDGAVVQQRQQGGVAPLPLRRAVRLAAGAHGCQHGAHACRDGAGGALNAAVQYTVVRVLAHVRQRGAALRRRGGLVGGAGRPHGGAAGAKIKADAPPHQRVQAAGVNGVAVAHLLRAPQRALVLLAVRQQVEAEHVLPAARPPVNHGVNGHAVRPPVRQPATNLVGQARHVGAPEQEAIGAHAGTRHSHIRAVHDGAHPHEVGVKADARHHVVIHQHEHRAAAAAGGTKVTQNDAQV